MRHGRCQVRHTPLMRPNIFTSEVDQSRREIEGFHADRVSLGQSAGCQRLGMSLWILPSGEAAYPYHFHLAEEEALIVLEGRPTLRTPDGIAELEQGDVVSFLAGESGAHQVLNDTETDVRFLAVSTSGQPDITLYPDTGKLGAAERRPGGGGLHHYFRIEDAVGYSDGMEPR